MEYFNEFGLQVITYNLAVFPHALTVADEMFQGWIMIGVIGFVFAMNLLVMVTTTLINLKRKLRLKSLKKIQDRRIKFLQTRAKNATKIEVKVNKSVDGGLPQLLVNDLNKAQIH